MLGEPMKRKETMRHLPAAAVVLAAAYFAAPAGAAPAPLDSTRTAVMARIGAGDDAAAVTALRAYVDAHPGDAVMRYNLACLEARLGRREAALDALATLARPGSGFDAVEQLEADPDLAPLRDDPRFRAVVTEIRSRLVLDASAQGVLLVPGKAERIRLRASGPTPLSAWPPFTLTWTTEALVVTEARGKALPPSAVDEPQLVLTIGPRDHDAPFLTRQPFRFAFGADAAGPWGAVWVPTLGRWQRVAELAPRTGNGGAWSVAVPWSLIQPFHPLADPDLGFNLTLPRLDGTNDFGVVPEPALRRPGAASFRVARLAFAADQWREAALVGRLADTIVHGDVLDFTLVVVAPEAGRGRLTLDFVDNRERSVLPDGPLSGTVDLVAGRQELPRQATFAGLGTGSYQLRAELVLPGNAPLKWGASLLNLAPGWDDSLAARCAAVAPIDAPTVAMLRRAVTTAVADHAPRTNPGPIARTLGDLDAMLTRARKTGSAWPEAGPGLVAYAGPSGQERLASVFRPAPGAGRGRETPVLVLGPPAAQAALPGLLARFYANGDLAGAGGRHPVYVVPELPEDADAAEIEAALAFLGQRFGAVPVWVAGLGDGPWSAPGIAARAAGVTILAAADGWSPAADRLVQWAEDLPAAPAPRR